MIEGRYREYETVTKLASYFRSGRADDSFLAWRRSDSAVCLRGDRHYTACWLDGPGDRIPGCANGRRGWRTTKRDLRQCRGTDHCGDCAFERPDRSGEGIDHGLDYREHP